MRTLLYPLSGLLTLAIASVPAVVAGAAPVAADKPAAGRLITAADVGRRPPKVTAPVVYKDLMLVLVTKDGAAAVAFTEVFDEETSDTEKRYCVKYRFRYESRDGKTHKSGIGVVYERYTKGRYDHGDLFVTAGPIRVEWSRGGAKRGWIYYAPEKTRVHAANARGFEDWKGPFGTAQKRLDLRRFMKPLQ